MKIFLVLAILFLPLTLTWAEEKHADEHGHDSHENSDFIELSPEQIAQSKITIATAQSGIIRQGIEVYGTVKIANNSQSHIRARFPGTVTKLFVSLGDTVSKGQKLAVIEANQSLQHYTVSAPIAGFINESHANLGEFVSEQRLFSIIDPNDKWAELLLFPSQFANVKNGAAVVLKNQQQQISTTVNNIIINEPQGLYHARVKLENSDWPIASPITATIYTQETTAAIRINSQALQQVEGKTVIFIKKENQFHATEVTLGLQDSSFSEVLEGIAVGESYASEGSFILKADLLKSGAAHQH